MSEEGQGMDLDGLAGQRQDKQRNLEFERREGEAVVEKQGVVAEREAWKKEMWMEARGAGQTDQEYTEVGKMKPGAQVCRKASEMVGEMLTTEVEMGMGRC